MNGALASLLSTLAMSLGNSYVFVSFYKTMILVFGLGLLHSVVFLPVILSFFGPRRTSKPRVFGGNNTNNTSNSGRSHDRPTSVSIGNSIQNAGTTEDQTSNFDKSPQETAVFIPLENLPPSSSSDRHSSVSTTGGDRTRRSSLFAGERDGLSGYEGRPVAIVVDRKRPGYSGMDPESVAANSPDQLRSIRETEAH